MAPVARAVGRSGVVLRRSAAARRRTAGVVLSGVAATLLAMAGVVQWDRRELLDDLRADIHRDLRASGVALHKAIILIQRSGMDMCRDFQLCVRLVPNGSSMLVYVRDAANDRLLQMRGGAGAENEARLTADLLDAIGVRADEADTSRLVLSDR